MKIINYNSALLLFEKVELLEKTRHDSWRCIYINLSKLRRSYNPALTVNFVVKGINEMLAEFTHVPWCGRDAETFLPDGDGGVVNALDINAVDIKEHI